MRPLQITFSQLHTIDHRQVLIQNFSILQAKKPIFLILLIWRHINLHLSDLFYTLKSFLPMICHFHLVFYDISFYFI